MVNKQQVVNLVSQAEYARRAGVNRSVICRQVRDRLIPVHGPRRLIDPNEADKARRENLSPVRGGARAPYVHILLAQLEDRFIGIGIRLRDRLAKETNPIRCECLVNREICLALDELSGFGGAK